MPRMQFRIKPEQFTEKKEFITSKDDVNVVTVSGISYNGKITQMDTAGVTLIDKRSHKHSFKVNDISEIVAENFL